MSDSMPRLYPSRGILSIPHAGLGNRQNLGMRPKDILADNLNRLMQARPNLETNLKIVAQSGGRLSNGKLGRIRLGGKTDIETIGELAEVFQIEPWQLLVEGLNPYELPELTTTPLVEQIRALVAVPQSQDSAKNDRAGKPHSKVLPPPEVEEHNDQAEPKFGPALTKFFNSGKGGKDGKSITDATARKAAASTGKRGGGRS